MDIQIKSLEYFVQIVETGSFTAASKSLYIGQPALSKTINKLELELNTVLFDRSKRDIVLTENGVVLYSESKEILRRVNNIPATLHNLTEEVRGEIIIGLPQIIGAVCFPKIADQFIREYPEVALTTIEKGGVLVESLVSNNEADIGFVILPTQQENLSEQLLFEDDFVVCVAKSHPFANRIVVGIGELANEDYILFHKSFTLYKLVMEECAKANFSPKVAFQSTQWDLVLGMVSANLGITVIPKTLTEKLKDNDNIRTIDIKNTTLSWKIGFITNEKAYHSIALKKFIQVITEIFNIEKATN